MENSLQAKQAEISQLERRLRELRTEPQPERVCSTCGIEESNAENASLVSCRVIMADGEEGFADIEQLLCERHLVDMIIGLEKLGFKDHRHGSIDYLEDESCPGFEDMEKCKTPTEYGRVVVGNPYYNESF